MPQTLEEQAAAQYEYQANDERGSGRVQRFFALSISLKRKADALYQLHQAGQKCLEQWLQVERAAVRARWLWMAYEFNSAEYMTAYHASISI